MCLYITISRFHTYIYIYISIYIQRTGPKLPSFRSPRLCSAALVALHPDEATEAVVDAALALRKPFLVVPCCAFGHGE